MKCYIISGYGPAHIDEHDLRGTIMDDEIYDSIKRLYAFNGKNMEPQSLRFGGRKLLRSLNFDVPHLTMCSLNQIMSEAKIEHEMVPISNIWNNKQYKIDEKSIVCLSTTFIWNTVMFDWAMKWIRQNFRSYELIVGGQYASMKYEYIMENYEDVSYIIVGDGEKVLSDIVSYCKSEIHNVDISRIPNLVYKKSGKLICNQNMHFDINDLPRIEFPKEAKVIPYSSMRGCPFQCAFCAQSANSTFRYLSAERIIDDWKYYKEKNDVKYIYRRFDFSYAG